jgi:hypothetical protein
VFVTEAAFVHAGFAYVPEVDDGDFDGDRMVYSFAHRAVAPTGERVRIPFNPSFDGMEPADFAGWVLIGCPLKAEPLVKAPHFTDGDLEWLADIARAHNVPPGDFNRLAVLARLYGDGAPEVPS